MLKKKIININNITYYYYDEGSGDTLLLLHGWLVQSDDYLRLILELSKKFRIITPDLPNFGNSKTTEPFVLDTYLLFLERFIKSLKINPVLIGHSFGGRIALEYSIRKETQKTKIILINSAGLRIKKNKLLFVFSVFSNSMYELFSQEGFFPMLRILKNWFKNFLNNARRDNFWNFFTEMLFTDILLLSNLKKDCILLWGEHDFILTKEYAIKFNRMIKNSKLIFIKGGHFSCINNASLFSKQISNLTNQCLFA